MGYGPLSPGGKQLPVTPYKGSWAWEIEQRRLNPNPEPIKHNFKQLLAFPVQAKKVPNEIHK